MVGMAWEGIFFGELQFDGLTGVKRALEETAGQGPGEGACPGLQAPRRGSQRRKSPERRGQRTGPAPREGGYSWREKRTQGQPRCCHRSGQRGAQKSCGLDIPTLAALPSHGPPRPEVLVPSSLLLKALSSPVWEDSVVLYGVILCVPVTWAVVPVLICPVSSRVWRALHRPGLCPARLRRRLEGGGLGGED